MSSARELIAVFHELNATPERNIACLTPSLIGMFGTAGMFDQFLTELDNALASGQLSPQLRERAKNLTRTFIPQVADFNSIKDLPQLQTSPAELRAVCADDPTRRREGVQAVLAGLMQVLTAVNAIA